MGFYSILRCRRRNCICQYSSIYLCACYSILEYGFRKTFYDNFDGVKDLVAPSDYSWLHHNDWYSFTGIAVTWKIYNKLAGCPAYGDAGSKRKR